MFSLAFAVIDRLTSSVSRSQDVLRCKAFNAHIFEGEARDVINKDNKTYSRQARTKKGAQIHHKNSPNVAGMYVVLIVVYRPLMRKLLQLYGTSNSETLELTRDSKWSQQEDGETAQAREKGQEGAARCDSRPVWRGR